MEYVWIESTNFKMKYNGFSKTLNVDGIKLKYKFKPKDNPYFKEIRWFAI